VFMYGHVNTLIVTPDSELDDYERNAATVSPSCHHCPPSSNLLKYLDVKLYNPSSRSRLQTSTQAHRAYQANKHYLCRARAAFTRCAGPKSCYVSCPSTTT